MPAVLNGVTALIASVISAISAALLSLSAKRVVAVNSFACVLVYPVLLSSDETPVRRSIVVAIITSRGARGVTVSAISSALTPTVVSPGVSRFRARCRI